MSTDINLFMEIKKDGIWKSVGEKSNSPYYHFDFKKSVLWLDGLIGLIFCQRHLRGGYIDELVPYILESPNGKPENITPEVEQYLCGGSYRLDGHITKDDIEKFNWDFNIPFQVMVSSEVKKEYITKGKIPDGGWATAVSPKSKWVELEFSVPFKEKYKKWFEELKYLESLGEDYRYLFYFF